MRKAEDVGAVSAEHSQFLRLQAECIKELHSGRGKSAALPRGGMQRRQQKKSWIFKWDAKMFRGKSVDWRVRNLNLRTSG